MKEYKQLVTSISGNRKTSNAIDVVRGCVGAQKNNKGCYNSCYAFKMARVGGVDFSKPVINTFNEDKLRKQLKTNSCSWIRVGTIGDPSFDWLQTTQVCELIHEAGKVPVVMTKVWDWPSREDIIPRLATAKAQIQIGLSALDKDTELSSRSMFISAYYAEYPQGTIAKVMTIPWADKKMAKDQDNLVELARTYRFMELPLRVFKTVPYSDKVDWDLMRHHHSPFTGKEDHSWTAGQMYRPKTKRYNAWRKCTNDGKYTLCPETTCDKCPHLCGTKCT